MWLRFHSLAWCAQKFRLCRRCSIQLANVETSPLPSSRSASNSTAICSRSWGVMLLYSRLSDSNVIVSVAVQIGSGLP